MKLTQWQQALVGLVLILLVGLGMEFFVLKDDKARIKKTKTDITELERKIAVAKRIKAAADELNEQMNHLKAQLERLKKILPLEINKPKFMADIKRYANENGIEILRVSRNKSVVDDVIEEHPFTYMAKGRYHDFGNFFAQLSNYPRITNIKGVQLIRQPEDTTYSVEGSFIISVYTYREPTEEELRQQIQAKKEARSKTRKNT